MFNPKQALERIRKTKTEKVQNNSNGSQHVQPLFPERQESQPKTNSIEDRVNKLQEFIAKLSEDLSMSNQAVSRLKRQNSNLQTQILKLEYENSQLKSQQVYSQIRRNSSASRLPEPIKEQSKQREAPIEKPRIKTESLGQPLTSVAEKQSFSNEVEQFLQQIHKQPVDKLLKRKQYQFRALKSQKRQDQKSELSGVNKYLKDLAKIQKDYKQYVTNKPVIVIKLDDADFQ